jgi:hypothetical protein
MSHTQAGVDSFGSRAPGTPSPLTIVAIFIGLEIGLPRTYYGSWLLWVDVAIALTAMGYGGYLLLRCRAAISR